MQAKSENHDQSEEKNGDPQAKMNQNGSQNNNIQQNESQTQEEQNQNMDNSSTDENNRNKQESEDQIQESIPEIITKNQTSVMVLRSHDDHSPEDECSYCQGKRQVDNPETGEQGIQESGKKYHKLGFTSTKMRVDDLEHCLNQGFTRCGTYIYIRSSHKSCCEVWQYRVDINQFKISQSQKKVIRRFHRYLNYGHINAQENEEEKMQEVEQIQINDQIMGSKQYYQKLQEIIEKIYLDLIKINFGQNEYFIKLPQRLQDKHKVTFNQKLNCLQSNILNFSDKQKIILNQEFLQNIQSILKEEIFKDQQLKQHITDIEIKNFQNAFFLNFILSDHGKKQFQIQNKQESSKTKFKKCKSINSLNEIPTSDPKYTKFQEYLDPHIPYKPVQNPKHVYTIEIHKALYTEELYELYQKYEKAVHKKDRDKDQLKRFVCSSPVYDPENPVDHERITRIAPTNFARVDEGREFKDEGLYPGKGSFHYYHRIDGKLVAMGVNDITNSILNAQYFIYDPDFNHLCLGVVGAIHEIEFMKKIQKNYNPLMRYYQLGELVFNCPKVNYKLNYKPGLLICPRTKEMVNFDDVKDKVIHYSKLPYQFKQDNLESCSLVDLPYDQQTENESILKNIDLFLYQWPFLYENTRMLTLNHLSYGGQDHMKSLIKQMIKELGFEFVANALFELKFEPKKDPENIKKESDTDEKQESKDEQKNEEKEQQQQNDQH